ncbi:MAG: AFG1/ZapE family ATPase [Angustibacter sp.]
MRGFALSRSAVRDAAGSCDDFPSLVAHLATVHPSRYRALVADLPVIGWTDVQHIDDQHQGLRVVALADRIYDAGISLYLSGAPIEELFSARLLSSGYRKKYLRAVSRLRARNACSQD